MNVNSNSVEETTRAAMAQKYGSWYKKNASASELVSWCNDRIAKCNEWIENLKVLREESQKQLFKGMTKEEVMRIAETLD